MASTDGEGPRDSRGTDAPASRRVWLYADRPGKCSAVHNGVRFTVVEVRRKAVAIVIDQAAPTM